jgi:hypothetical protein
MEIDKNGNLNIAAHLGLTRQGIQEFVTSGFTYPGEGENVTIIQFDHSGNVTWYVAPVPSEITTRLTQIDDIAVCPDGNVYVAGSISLLTDMDPGLGEDIHGKDEEYTSAAYVSKYSSAGEYIWTRTWSDREEGSFCTGDGSLCIDGSGNIFRSGYFEGLVGSDNESGWELTAGIYEDTTQDFPDVFIISYTPDGSIRWAESIGGPDWDRASSMCSDGYGNIFLTGKFLGIDPAEIVLDPADGAEFWSGYLAMCSDAGDFSWIGYYRDWYWLSPEKLDTDAYGNVYVLGYNSNNRTTTLMKFTPDEYWMSGS